MTPTITYVSKWRHISTGKICKVTSRKESSSRMSKFVISGHNPLPCLSFKGTYGILVKWFKANGWEKIVNTDDYTPDTMFVQYK